MAYKLLTDIPGVTCVKPKAALYMFPRLDPHLYPIADDQAFCLPVIGGREGPDCAGHRLQLPDTKTISVWCSLPNTDDLAVSVGRIAHFLEGYRKRHGNV